MCTSRTPIEYREKVLLWHHAHFYFLSFSRYVFRLCLLCSLTSFNGIKRRKINVTHKQKCFSLAKPFNHSINSFQLNMCSAMNSFNHTCAILIHGIFLSAFYACSFLFSREEKKKPTVRKTFVIDKKMSVDY